MNDETKLTLTKEEIFYLAVGQGISMWTSSEGSLIDIAAHLLGSDTDRTGCVFYSINNFYSWLNIIDDLFLLQPRYGEARKKWTTLSHKMRALNDTRVRLAHHTTWDHGGPRNVSTPSRYDTRSKSRKYEPLTLSQVGDFCFALGDLFDDMEAIMVALRAASPERPAPPPADPPKEGAR